MSLEMVKYESMEKAFESVLQPDQECTVIRHVLNFGDSFPLHRHFAREWIVTNSGNFRIDLVRGSMKWIPEINGAAVVPLPVGTSHGIHISSNTISYFVLREKWSWRPRVMAHRIVDFILKTVTEKEG